MFTLAHFDNLEHAIEDIDKKWTRSIFYGKAHMDGVARPYQVKEIGGGYAILADLEGGESEEFNPEDIVIIKEYPVCGVFKHLGDVYIVKKVADRQWKRGWNDDTILLRKMTKNNNRKPDGTIYRSAYDPIYDTPNAALNIDVGRVAVVSSQVWLQNLGEGVLRLYFEDVFVGFVSKDREFFPVEDAYTLAEIAIDELQLR